MGFEQRQHRINMGNLTNDALLIFMAILEGYSLEMLALRLNNRKMEKNHVGMTFHFSKKKKGLFTSRELP